MTLGILLRIAAVYMAVVGLGLIFFPRAFGSGAVPIDASPALIAFLRLWGSPLLGIAALNWVSRNAEPSTAFRGVILGNIIGFGVIAALDLWGLLSGGRELTRVFVVVHLLFTLAFIRAGRKGLVAEPPVSRASRAG